MKIDVAKLSTSVVFRALKATIPLHCVIDVCEK